MAFYKKQKLNGKWYPRAITKGRTATTDDVAKRLSLISTVSPGDTYASSRLRWWPLLWG